MSQENDQRKITFKDGRKVKVRDFSIDMEIRMPEECNLYLMHRFSNATVGDLSGRFELKTEYGELKLGTLTGTGTLQINFGEATVTELKEKGVVFTSEVQDMGFGLVTHFLLPGAGRAQLYQPRYDKG